METRFWDKAHLSSYALDTKIYDQYGFTVSDASPVRSVFLLTTSEGFKILKKISYELEELIFIQTALEKVRNQYPFVVQFKNTKEGKPYALYEQGVYVVLDLIEGRECIFENPIDLEKVSVALARYHMAAEGISATCAVRNYGGRMISIFHEMVRKMNDFKGIAEIHVNKSEFDKVFLEHYEYYAIQAKRALEKLEQSRYRELCRDSLTLCHHDLAHHNIIIGEDENVYFIDFDYALIDLPCHDVSNFIRKTSKYNCWSVEAFDRIIRAYSKAAGPEKLDMDVLYAYMLFPYDFFSVANFYYSKVKDWEEEEYFEKLVRKISFKEEREELLFHIDEFQLGR